MNGNLGENVPRMISSFTASIKKQMEVAFNNREIQDILKIMFSIFI